MTLSRLKYAIITRERPTLFLTERAELSEQFDEAELFDGEEAAARLKTLDEPDDFTLAIVTYSVEV